MKPEFWIKRWEKKEIGFHQSDFNPFLKKYGELYFKKSNSIFLPFCGKTKDLIWFRDRGFIVTGIEISEIACNEFFLENQIHFYKESQKDYIFYWAYDFPLRIIQGDYFSLSKEILNIKAIHVDSLYDRAALVALPKEMRKLYVQKIVELFPIIETYFLITMEFESPQQKEEVGPPFSVIESEIHELFSDFTSIKLVEEQSMVRSNGTPAIEKVFVLEKRHC